MIMINRRDFLRATLAGGTLCLGYVGAGGVVSAGLASGACSAGMAPGLVSPGCRRSKVRVAKIYMANTNPMWPHPHFDIKAEVQKYEAEFSRLKNELADVDFVCSELVTSPERMKELKSNLQDVDGILVIHIAWSIMPILHEVLSIQRPTALFAAPYSGHDWTQFGALRKQKEGALLECFLTSDMDQLAVAVRPFRAIHHLREAKILDVTTRDQTGDYPKLMKERFGTEYKIIGRDQVLQVYEAISEDEAKAEADRWIAGAEKVVEPSRDEIVRSCRLALAFEKLLAQEEATVLTVDCYGSMFHKLPAFPCIGFSRLNNMGLGGICESDLMSAMTHILFQGLVGKPGFISDPTLDVSKNSIILAHCLGSQKMNGPDGEAAPYKLRCIMERQEGAVAQTKMRVGQKVTQAKLVAPEILLYFTGEIIDAPDIERACRTKITVKVDGDAEKLWQNWSHGLHRVTCYGDLTKDLERFCRYKDMKLVNEA